MDSSSYPQAKEKLSTTAPRDGESVTIKGTLVCVGKIEARVCIASSLDDAENIQVNKYPFAIKG